MEKQEVTIRSKTVALGPGWSEGEAVCIETGFQGGHTYIHPSLVLSTASNADQPVTPKEVVDLVEALVSVRAIISEAAGVGFLHSEGDWVEKLFASQYKTYKALGPYQKGYK